MGVDMTIFLMSAYFALNFKPLTPFRQTTQKTRHDFLERRIGRFAGSVSQT